MLMDPPQYVNGPTTVCILISPSPGHRQIQALKRWAFFSTTLRTVCKHSITKFLLFAFVSKLQKRTQHMLGNHNDRLVNKSIKTNMFCYIYYSNMFQHEWFIIRLAHTTAQLQEWLVSFNSLACSPLLKYQQRVSINIWPVDQLAFLLNSRMFSD